MKGKWKRWCSVALVSAMIAGIGVQTPMWTLRVYAEEPDLQAAELENKNSDLEEYRTLEEPETTQTETVGETEKLMQPETKDIIKELSESEETEVQPDEQPVLISNDIQYLFSAADALQLDNWLDIQNKSRVTVEGDVLKIDSDSNVQISPDIQTSGNALYAFDFKITSASLGLQFNMKETGKNNWDTAGYLMNISQSGHVDFLVSDGTRKTTIGTGEINDFKPNDFNHVEVSYLESGSIEISFNNRAQALIAVMDTKQTYGYFGLVTMGKNPKSEVKNFCVTGTRKEDIKSEAIFSDDFSGDLSQWKQLQNEPEITEGWLRVSDGKTMQIAVADEKYFIEGDAEYEFDIRSFANGAAGIQFNSAGKLTAGAYDSSCYYINVRKSVIQYCKDNVYKTVPIPQGVDTGKEVHVKVVYFADKGQIQVYLNDKPALTWDDADYTRGYFGFISMGTKAEFDNVSVKGKLKDMGDIEFEKIVKRTSIIYKPLRDASQITFPSISDKYEIQILSTSPEGYIGNDGKIVRRPSSEDGEIDIDVTFSLTDKQKPENNQTRTLSVPLSPEYTGPVVSEEEAKSARTHFEGEKYGLFVHYVAGLTRDTNGTTVHDIDVLAEDFDAAQFASDVHDMGFEYVIFTVAHSQQRNLYPSKTMKRWRDDRRKAEGVKTYTDEVDVIEELYQALKPYDIDLHLYLCELDGLYWSGEDRENTGWDDCGQEADGDHERYNQFQLEIADEMAQRYAGKIKGFWFDGYFIHGPAGTTGPTHGVINQDEYRAALLAYDPGLALVGNIGTNRQKNPYPEWTSLDYRCQELYNFGDTYYNQEATEDDAKTWTLNEHQAAQVVTQGKNWWAVNKNYNLRVTKENLFLYVVGASSLSKSGGVALSMGVFPGTAKEQTNGDIWEGNTLEEFTAMNKQYIAPVAESIKNTKAGQAYTTKNNSWLANEGWGVSTESEDGRYVYLHITAPPVDSKSLRIPDTEDRSVLGGKAELLKYDGTKTKITFEKAESGYEITLPEGEEWHELDTIIKVERVKPANPDTITYVPGISDDWSVAGNWAKQDKIGNVMSSRNDSCETKEAGAVMSYSFEGDVVEVWGNKASNYGKMEIIIDGKQAAVIDCRDEKVQRDVLLYTSDELGEGSHSISLKNVDAKAMAVYGLTIRKFPEREPSKTEKIIVQINQAENGDIVKIPITDQEPGIDKEVFAAAQGKNVTLQLVLSNGVIWEVNGTNIETPKDLNLEVILNTENIPKAVLDGAEKGSVHMQFTLAYKGEFGFSADMIIPLGAEMADKELEIYYYNPKTESLEHISTGKADGQGNMRVTLTHASDYAMFLKDSSQEPENPTPENPIPDNPAPDNPTSDNPTPDKSGIDKPSQNHASSSGNGGTGAKNEQNTVVKTGDVAPISVAVVFLLLSMTAIIFVLIFRRKKI